jgi:hypothetical protein
MRRNIPIIIAIILAAGLMSSVALAAGYKTWTGPGTPHSDYSSTSDKCEVCHAVHGAGPSGEILLGAGSPPTGFTVANACNYCHITTTTSVQRPYGDNTFNYTLDTRWNHSGVGYDSIGNPAAKASLPASTVVATCARCHATHGANTLPSTAFPTTTIAKINPSSVAGADAGGATAEEQRRSYCANCHRRDHFSTTYNGAAPANYFGYSHVMNSNAGQDYGNPAASFSGIVAWTNSVSCEYCHTVNFSSPTTWPARERNSFPHFVGGATADVGTTGSVDVNAVGYFQLLNINYYGRNDGTITSTAKKDVICLSCHRQTPTGPGVGYTY